MTTTSTRGETRAAHGDGWRLETAGLEKLLQLREAASTHADQSSQSEQADNVCMFAASLSTIELRDTCKYVNSLSAKTAMCHAHLIFVNICAYIFC